MRKIPWVGFTFALLAWVWVGCGGNAVTGPGTGGSAGSSGTGGSGATAGNGGAGGSAGTVDCNRACAGPPPGCRFDGEPTCDPPTCPPIVCDDAGVDAPADVAWDSSLPDPSAFAGLLNGVWLIGWSGGMNHYSWVRLSSAPNWGGEAEFLTGADLFANIPFWDCSGVGSWMITAKPYTIGLQFPSSCSQGFESYTFLTLQPTTSPSGAVLRASLEDLTNPNALVEGYKFPSNWCVASMTSCPDPWQ